MYFTYAADNPEDFEGAPVGLQLVGRPQEEEAVIGMTEVVDRALKGFRDAVVVTEAEVA
jgi:amidase